MTVPHLAKMEAFKIVALLQAVVLCQDKFAIQPTSRSCSWTVTSLAENQSSVAFTSESVVVFAAQICQALDCGQVYELKESIAEPNRSCFAGCIYHNNKLSNCSQSSGRNCRIVSEVVCDAPYLALTSIKSNPCNWNLMSLKNESSVVLTQEMFNYLCQSLGCGDAYELPKVSTSSSSTCLSNCIYHNLHLWNCSTVVNRSDCTNLSQVTCGNEQVRLVGGSHHCAGRVELWRAGQWGTVCDDDWDERDGDVVCAQMNCGYAISVTGQGDPYSQGKGAIHLDELNCTGKERNLWECPALRDGHDCGHKEDAGVVCSEYKALRLTGGLDRCSGKVEIHRNGSWGTVCDDSWLEQQASLACELLDCGPVQNFSDFKITFTHSNGTQQWFYFCSGDETDLWQCREYDGIKLKHLCQNSNAAGLICKNSLGLPVPTSSLETTPAVTTVQMTTAEPKMLWSLELLGCIALSGALLIALVANIIMCCVARKRKVMTVKQHYSNLQTSVEAEENNYRESVNLVKVTTSDVNPSAQTTLPAMWTQSSIESGSVDTDYEQDCTFSLSTFHNSMRYSAEGRTPATKGEHLQSVAEERGRGDVTMQGYQYQPTIASDAFQSLNAAPSVDSFDTSSTSSGEFYENTGKDDVGLNCEVYGNTGENSSDLQPAMLPIPPPTTNGTEDFLNQPVESCPDHSSGFVPSLNPDSEEVRGEEDEAQRQKQARASELYREEEERLSVECSSGGDESPIYSPVSIDMHPGTYSSESEYDDVGNYLQSHGQ